MAVLRYKCAFCDGEILVTDYNQLKWKNGTQVFCCESHRDTYIAKKEEAAFRKELQDNLAAARSRALAEIDGRTQRAVDMNTQIKNAWQEKIKPYKESNIL